jgi:hypothetical protein
MRGRYGASAVSGTVDAKPAHQEKQIIMKRFDSTISNLFSGRVRVALIGTSIVMAPFAARAHGGGSASFSHGGGPSHISSGGFSRSVAGNGIAANRVGDFSRGGGNVAVTDNRFAKAEAGLRQFPYAPETTPQPAREFRTKESPDARIRRQFDQLAKRDDKDGDFRFRRERLFRTRDFLIGLVEFGWPVDLVDTWTDAIAMDDILVGMPSDLVLDYWGNPVSIDPVNPSGGQAQIWTYRSRLGNRMKVTILGNKVTSVRRA